MKKNRDRKLTAKNREERMIDQCIRYSDGWETKNVPGSLNVLYPVLRAPISPMKKRFGFCYNVTICIFNMDQVEWFWAKSDIERIKDLVIERGFSDQKFISQIYKKWDRFRLQFEAAHKKFYNVDLTSLSNKKLLRIYDEIYRPYFDESSTALISDAVSINSEVWLKQVLEKDSGKSLDKDFSTLVAFNFETFVNEEKKDLLKILEYIQRKKIINFLKDKETLKLLKKHSDNYFWIRNNYSQWTYLDKEFFASEIEKMISSKINAKKSLAEIERDKTDFFKRRGDLLKKLNLSKKSLFMLDIFEIFGKMLDLRKRCCLMANHHIFRILKEISDRTDLDYEALKYSIKDELPNILIRKNKGKWEKELSERAKRVAVFCYKDETLITTKRIDKNIFYSRVSSEEEVHGAIAFKGKVQGYARILLNSKNMDIVKEGDILFASNTTPDYVPAMKKAAAFVTDLGGVTSHAAIVAREMKKPCIIGTKVGTRIFKNGDLVEVNANDGVVKIIK